MNIKKSTLLGLCLSIATMSYAQEFTQSIKGKIVDEASQQPLSFATVTLLNTDPVLGTTADEAGIFLLEDVALGRYDIQVAFLGYETAIIPEVVVSAAKAVYLDVKLRENTYLLDEVVVKPKIVKNSPINTMATLSARMLSVEEASRYAGGFDDPARLASSFPGVASSVGNNAIVIRGNAPKFLQWKVEGVEIPNPNHFADLGAIGGGGLTALSSNLLANSDFYTGAFPAEYSNALSGVFDIRMRNGNSSAYEHSIEVGAIGIDFASEGPMSKKNNAAYLINYRYSTLGLVSSLLPEDAQGTNYQDLSFKLKLPAENAGVFTLWGIGLIDRSGARAETEAAHQNYYQDIEEQDAKQYMGAFGIGHKLVFENAAYLNSTIAVSTNGLDLRTDRLDGDNQLRPQNEINSTNYNFTFKSFLNKKFSARHTNRTGVTLRGMSYKLSLKEANESGNPLATIAGEDGFSTLLATYSASSFSYDKWHINAGINAQLFTLNNNFTIEPRLGISHQLSNKSKLSFAYGLHSRLEPLSIYFANTSNAASPQANSGLDFSKAHHFVMAYDLEITEKLHLKVEPYFQYLFNIPIIANSTSSLLNLQNDWFINDAYINAGNGRNYGIDLTFEQFINNGFYYLLSGAVFNSSFKTDTDEWYDTRFNQNYLFNALAGKEFRLGKEKQNLLGLNVRLSLQGGDRYSIVDESASALAKDVVYDERIPFTEQTKPSTIWHFTVNYEWFKTNASHKLSLKVLNATNFEAFLGHRYNIKSNQVEEFREALMIPNVSYKLSF